MVFDGDSLAGVKSCEGNFPTQNEAAAGNFPKKIRELPLGIQWLDEGSSLGFKLLDEGSSLDFDSLVRVAINVDFAKIWGILSKKYEVGKVPLFRKVPWEGEQSAGVQKNMHILRNS